MINNKNYNLYPLEYIIELCEIMYGMKDINIDDIVDVLPLVLVNLPATINSVSGTYTTKSDENSEIKDFPCSVTEIKEVLVKTIDKCIDCGYLPISFYLSENSIKIDTCYSDKEIIIKYVSQLEDDKGYPMLNFNQSKAVASYLAYRKTVVKSMQGVKDVDVQFLYQEYIKNLKQAKVDVNLNDNLGKEIKKIIKKNYVYRK